MNAFIVTIHTYDTIKSSKIDRDQSILSFNWNLQICMMFLGFNLITPFSTVHLGDCDFSSLQTVSQLLKRKLPDWAEGSQDSLKTVPLKQTTKKKKGLFR